MEYYVFSQKSDADSCLNAINASGWFPVRGNIKGKPAPDEAQKTVKWADEPREMTSGEWAIPRIPKNRLDGLGVPQSEQDTFLATYGQDIRDLTSEDFPVVDGIY